ncbi:hypothetical protein IJI76_02535 [Candidatus Saccharibacteria bacterium]|nr:hypothetical protein [Candidatus Saccharibacteria bacterium]
MAGMIEHLYFNGLIYHSLSIRPTSKILKNGDIRLGSEFKQLLNRERFILTGILPDMAKNQFSSHFRYRTRKAPGVFLPDINTAERLINRATTDWSIKMGIYSHFWFDMTFLTDFIIPRFDFRAEDCKIRNIATGELFTPEDFIRELRHAYSETTAALLASEKLKVKAIRSLPDEICRTTVPEFDTIVEEPWKEKFKRYLENSKVEKNKLFNVEDYIRFIEDRAVTLTALMFYKE